MTTFAARLVFGFSLVVLLAESAAAATIIGNFRYEEDIFAGVANLVVDNTAASGDPFDEIVIDLETTDPAISGLYGYGTVGGGFAGFVLDYTNVVGFAFAQLGNFQAANLPLDLFAIPPQELVTASLTLTFQGLAVINTPAISLLNPSSDITIASSPVPEPGTLMLLGAGGLAALVRRRRAARSLMN